MIETTEQLAATFKLHARAFNLSPRDVDRELVIYGESYRMVGLHAAISNRPFVIRRTRDGAICNAPQGVVIAALNYRGY